MPTHSPRVLSFKRETHLTPVNSAFYIQTFAAFFDCCRCSFFVHSTCTALTVELNELSNPAVTIVADQPYRGRDLSCAPEGCKGILTRVSSYLVRSVYLFTYTRDLGRPLRPDGGGSIVRNCQGISWRFCTRYSTSLSYK